MSIHLSYDGKNILSASDDGIIKIWNIKGGKEICELRGHAQRIREATFHPIHENIVAIASNDKTFRMWQFELE